MQDFFDFKQIIWLLRAKNPPTPFFAMLPKSFGSPKNKNSTLTLYLYRDRYRLMKTVQFWTVRFHETSLLILSLLIILDYFITDWFYNNVFKR